MSVIHWSEKPNFPALCGCGLDSTKPPHTQDKSKVTCKKCLKILVKSRNSNTISRGERNEK